MAQHATYIGVIGPSQASPDQLGTAEEVGRLLARASAVVVTGGQGGVMEAAARGAYDAGGQTLGLLPGHDRTQANPWLSMSIPTGLGDMRNVLLVRTCSALIAIGGSWGTLSEIALGISAGKPVYVVNGWRQPADGVTHLDDAAEAVRQALAALS